MKITSPSFQNQRQIPQKFSCDGQDVNPELNIFDVPPNTLSLVLVVNDPDAPSGNWIHWLVWNIDPKTTKVLENSVPEGALQGTNSAGNLTFHGPCPPSGTHRYFFRILALDSRLDLAEGSQMQDTEAAMQNHIISKAELVGLYSRE